MKQLDEVLLSEMTARLVSQFDPDQIILFGSHAWGSPSTDSDIDLLVIVPDSQERPAARMRRALACLEGLNVAKDVLVRTRQETERYRKAETIGLTPDLRFSLISVYHENQRPIELLFYVPQWRELWKAGCILP